MIPTNIVIRRTALTLATISFLLISISFGLAKDAKDCAVWVKAPVFDYRFSLDKESREWLIQYFVATSEFSTEQQAASMVGDLSIVYEAVPIDAHSDNKFEQLKQWRREHREEYMNAGAMDKLRQYSEVVINTEAVKEYGKNYRECINAPADTQLKSCKPIPVDDWTVQLFLEYNFAPGDVPDLKLNGPTITEGSTVSNAKPQRIDATGSYSKNSKGKESKAVESDVYRLAEKGQRIVPGGLVLSFQRIARDKTVTFNVNTKQVGSFICPPSPALPQYTIDAEILPAAEQLKTKEHTVTFMSKGTRCGAGPFVTSPDWPGLTCVDDEYQIKDYKIIAETAPKNPDVMKGSDCFKLKAANLAINKKKPNCFQTGVTINECGYDSTFWNTGCSWYLGNGVHYGIVLNLEKWEKIALKEVSYTWSPSAVPSSAVTLKYPKENIPEGIRNTVFNYKVRIVDNRNGAETKLSNDSAELNGFISSFDDQKLELLISIPNSLPAVLLQ